MGPIVMNAPDRDEHPGPYATLEYIVASIPSEEAHAVEPY
jgi:hypothetical protein